VDLNFACLRQAAPSVEQNCFCDCQRSGNLCYQNTIGLNEVLNVSTKIPLRDHSHITLAKKSQFSNPSSCCTAYILSTPPMRTYTVVLPPYKIVMPSQISYLVLEFQVYMQPSVTSQVLEKNPDFLQEKTQKNLDHGNMYII